MIVTEPEQAPRVSVVMATFNGSAYLREQLASLKHQTILPLELIVSDDGSKDDTIEIIEGFAAEAPFPVRIFRNAHTLGPSENFLNAARKAEGDFIAFCDQDDRWHWKKLETCTDALARSGALLCVHSVRLINEVGSTIGLYTQRKLGAPSPWHSYLGMTEVFRRELLSVLPSSPEFRGPDFDGGSTALGHDKWIMFVASSFGSVCHLGEPLAEYRLHGSNVSMSNDTLKLQSVQLSRAIGLPAHRDLGRVTIANRRQKILDAAAAAMLDRKKAVRTEREARRWGQISRFEDQRLRIYEDKGPIARFMHLVRLASAGGYRHRRSGGLGQLLLFKDLLIGVMRSRSVKI